MKIKVHGKRRRSIWKLIWHYITVFVLIVLGYSILFSAIWYAWGKEIDYQNAIAREFNEMVINNE